MMISKLKAEHGLFGQAEHPVIHFVTGALHKIRFVAYIACFLLGDMNADAQNLLYV